MTTAYILTVHATLDQNSKVVATLVFTSYNAAIETSASLKSANMLAVLSYGETEYSNT